MTQDAAANLSQPAASLVAQLARELRAHPPFAQMAPADVQAFVAHCHQRYYAPDEPVLGPHDGPVQHLLYVRRGAITGSQGLAQLTGRNFLYEAGELFPVSAVMAARAVTSRYVASEDSFVLALPVEQLQALAARSPPLADFLSRRVQQFLELSRRAVQDQYASRVLAEQSMETPLGQLARRAPVTCAPDTALLQALQTMHTTRVGSMLVATPEGAPLGILTRHDVLDRITLAGVDLSSPISRVMVNPVHSLTHEHTAQDAALMMSRYGIRHVPVTREGVLTGIVSERDLFAMQRLSVQQLSASLRKADSLETLHKLAPDIRKFAERLLGQGVQARQLTSLISHLNDLLTQRLLDLLAAQHGLPAGQACWLALGSEGREEQTVATDQDNALVLADETSDADLEGWLRLAQQANEELALCGFPLCSGDVMASNAQLCLRLARWQERFVNWVEFGTPQDLLNASIFFDLRGLWGDVRLAAQLRETIVQKAVSPRFVKLLALNALERTVPLGWTGAIDTAQDGTVDLKLRGTAIFVDAARLYALAHGVAATNTRERLLAVGPAVGAKPREYEGWVGAFEFLQMLRLQVQMNIAAGQGDPDHPNSVTVRTLNTIDRRILKESLRLLAELQQRMRLDWGR